MPTGYDLAVTKTYNGQANTSPATGAAPQAGDATHGLGVGSTDYGNPSTGACNYSINTNVATNSVGVTFPGVGAFEWPKNGATYTTALVTNGWVWVKNDGANNSLGPYLRSASGHTIGGSFIGGGPYIRAKDASATTADFFSWSGSGVTVPTDAWVSFRIDPIDATTLSATLALWSAATDPTAANPGTPLSTFTQTVNVTGRTDLLGACQAGQSSFNGGSSKAFLAFTVSVALGISSLTVLGRGSKAIQFTMPAATGGNGSAKTYNVQRRVNGSGNAFATIQAGATPGTITDTTVTAGVTYDYQATVTDSSGTATSATLTARALATTDILMVIDESDSNFDPTFNPGQKRAYEYHQDWLISLGYDVVVKSFGVSGSTSTAWTTGNAQSSILDAAIAWANLFGATHLICMIGTNDAKDAVATTNGVYLTNITQRRDRLIAGLTSTTSKICFASPGYIPADATGWSAASNGRITGYVTQIQALVGGRVRFLDDPATGQSWQQLGAATPGTYGLVANVHYNDAGHQAQALLWRRGFFAITSITINQGAAFTARGGVATALTATVVGEYTGVTWTIQGQAGHGGGTLAGSTYTAPGEFADASTVATLRATAINGLTYAQTVITTPQAGSGGGGSLIGGGLIQ